MLPEPTADGSKTRNLGFGTPHVQHKRRSSPGTPHAPTTARLRPSRRRAKTLRVGHAGFDR